MPVTARRLLAFDPVYGYPAETSSSDVVQLPKALLAAASGGIGLDAQGLAITGLPSPVNPSDAATKQYTDAIAQGISAVGSVAALAAVNVAALSGPQTVDGIPLVAGDRVLLTAQSNGAQNGVWIVQAGAWQRPTRPPDYLTGTGAAGRFCFVQRGNTYAEQGWVCTSDPGSDVVDTNVLAFTQFSGLGEVTAGAGLISNLNTISVRLAATPGLQFSGGALDTLLAPTGALAKDATGLSVKLSGTTLAEDGNGLRVLGLPSAFTIAQAAVSANVTSTNLNTLVGGSASQADALHTHQSVLSAQAMVSQHSNGATALAIGDPVCWSPTGDVLQRADAASTTAILCIGVAGSAIAASATGPVVKRGIAPGTLAGATPGAQVWLAAGGGMTQVLPQTGALIQLGFAKNATDLDVAIAYVGRRSA